MESCINISSLINLLSSLIGDNYVFFDIISKREINRMLRIILRKAEKVNWLLINQSITIFGNIPKFKDD